MNLFFEPISEDRFSEALALGAKVFPNHKSEIEAAYRRVLDPEKSYLNERRFLEYFAAIDVDLNKIVALTGLYNRKEHSESEVWLGWFCVDPEMRGKGLGRKVLDWTINYARKLGYKKFRLYTSTDSNEAAAQTLYERAGLKVYKREPSKDFEGEEILYREMDI